MHDCRCSDPYFILELLYGEETGRQTASQLRKRIQSFTPPLSPAPMDERDAVLITYADQFQRSKERPLQTFANFAGNYFKGVINGIHLLPFFPYSSDDGFSVIDYRKVNPEWGTWEDIAHIGKEYTLMVDAVVNHMSVQSEWFQGYLLEDERYRDYFISVPPETDLSMVVRPRTSPLLTRFETSEKSKWVWTTFSGDQVDLNYENPQVLLEAVENLLFYVENCAKLIRLDAIAYLWKEIGTTCIHHPKTHLVVNFFHALLKNVAPYVLLVTETNVPHEDNVSYFGNGHNEAHLVYNFALPPLVLHAFQNGDAAVLSEWAAGLTLPSNQVTYFNFLASHDGIGLNPARGILSEQEIEGMVGLVRKHGGLVSSKTNADGSESPYELNISYFDALSDPESEEPIDVQVKRFLASQAIMLSLVGLPGIYVHSLFGSRNWQKGVEIHGNNRAINRCKFDTDELTAALEAPKSLRHKVYQGYVRLLKARSSSAAFHPHGAQLIIPTNREVFSFLRISDDGMSVAFCLHNVSSFPQRLDLAWENRLMQGNWVDLLTGSSLKLPENKILLQGYQVMWLVPS